MKRNTAMSEQPYPKGCGCFDLVTFHATFFHLFGLNRTFFTKM